MGTIQYLLISTICISISYVIYLVISRNENNFKQLRFFLLGIIVLSLLIPFNNLQIDIFQKLNISSIQTSKETITTSTEKLFTPELKQESDVGNIIHSQSRKIIADKKIPWKNLLMNIYLIVVLGLLIRIVFHTIKLMSYTLKGDSMRINGATLIYSDKVNHPFSLFKWIFLPKEDSLNQNEQEEIITHEKIHVSQYHSIDNLLIELLSAVMWFNPLVWMMPNSIQLVHEYLADEGVLVAGADKNKYQALLLNQVAEERLVSLSSSFNQSLIKKRMIMMTKSEINKRSKSKVLILIPLTAILVFGVACVKGQEKEYLVEKAPPPKSGKVVTAVAPVRMNVLYLGVDNPMAIASSGYDASELEVSIDNGRIVGEKGNYTINPGKPGSATVTVSHNGKVIQESVFRVKTVPDPLAGISINKDNRTSYIPGGPISKTELLDAGEVIAFMRNFDFDLEFKITGFKLSAVIEGLNHEVISNSEKFTKDQYALINRIKPGDKIYFEDITGAGPDGIERKLNQMIFKIVDE